MEPCIWNPKDANHKAKKKQADAWIRLAELTGRPQSQQIEEDTDQTEDDPLIRDRTSTVTTPSTPPSRSPSRPPSIQAVTNKSRRPAFETAEKQMAVAFGQLTNFLGQRQNENIPAHKDDNCDLYAKLLAIKLRELSTDERKIMMYQIDGLFINRISQKSNERHTTYYYSRPSSMAGAYSTPSPQVTQSRPTSVNSVYSEPIHNNQSFFSLSKHTNFLFSARHGKTYTNSNSSSSVYINSTLVIYSYHIGPNHQPSPT
ncbi:unnamed protein product [Parnassius apollo]|uniref:(apollo) hypothetical protein n=1 Tax=Parnassius apollo TaxID=110799 RepID=A0A8S3XBP0_PARAO|nr:unnamed protein product [Parnassius apollo]